MNKIFFIITLFHLLVSGIYSEVAEKITLEEAVKNVVQSHISVKKALYEYERADSDELKNDAKYSYRAIADATIQQSQLPFNRANYLTGTKTQTNKYSAGIEKMFSTGTYFKVEGISSRFDSNAFEGPQYSSSNFGALAMPPLYTGELKATISQDLLKNAFGYSESRKNEIFKNQTEIKKNELSAQISGIIIQALIDFWSYSIALENVNSAERLYQNTKNIRNLFIRKRNLGLAESFEINNWNALLNQAESKKEDVKLKLAEAKNKLYRNLNLAAGTELVEISLLENLNLKPDYDEDLKYALANRADYKNIQKRMENAELQKKIAANSNLPDVKLSGSVSSKGQTIVSPNDNFTDKNQGTLSGNFKEYTAQLKISYPLFDPGRKAVAQDAEISLKQTLIDEERIRREIEDDIRQQISTLNTSYTVFQNTKDAENETRRYYNGLYNKFLSGKYDATTIKNALDGLIQSEMNSVQAKINFNINVMRYYIAKNNLLETFSIKLDDLVAK